MACVWDSVNRVVCELVKAALGPGIKLDNLLNLLPRVHILGECRVVMG